MANIEEKNLNDCDNHDIYCSESLIVDYNKSLQELIESYKNRKPDINSKVECFKQSSEFTFHLLTGSYYKDEKIHTGTYGVPNINYKDLVNLRFIINREENTETMCITIYAACLFGVLRLNKDWQYHANYPSVIIYKTADNKLITNNSSITIIISR